MMIRNNELWDNLNDFHVIGISYEKADIETRGSYAFFDDKIEELVQKAKLNGIDSFFVLSTCNRTEIYFFGPNTKRMAAVYCETVEGDLLTFLDIVFTKSGYDAVNHMFRVCAGLESQILGDFEVIGQMKTAFRKFNNYCDSNVYLERFINTAVQISRQVKNDTNLSDGATSVSYAAVQYILNNVPEHGQKNIVLFGTGKIGRNTCENLVKHTNSSKITLVNRSEDKAKKLGEKLDLTVKPIQELQDVLQSTDILIVATGAKNPTITKDLVPKNKEMIIIDLSLPENVDSTVNELEDVKVLNVDELSKITQRTMKERSSEIPKAEAIIRLKTWEFEDWLETRLIVPAIQSFQGRLNALKTHEIKQYLKATNKSTDITDRLIQKLTNRFAVYLQENPSQRDDIVNLMDDMFHLNLPK